MSESRKVLYTLNELRSNLKFTFALTLVAASLSLILIMILFATGRQKTEIIAQYENIDEVFVDFLFLNSALHSMLPDDETFLEVSWREQLTVFKDNEILEYYMLPAEYDSLANHVSGYMNDLYRYNIRGELFNNDIHRHSEVCVPLTERLYETTLASKAESRAVIEKMEDQRNVLRSLIQILSGSVVFLLAYLLIYSFYGNRPTKTV